MVDPNTILYAEDDQNYAWLFRTTLETGGFKHTLHHVDDGAAAIRYLKGEGQYADRSKFPLPSLVLADLKMPRVNGFELLQWIRKQPAYCHLPVVVLTSSDETKEIQRAYTLGANSFLVKPPHVEDLKSLLKMIDGYWLGFNRTENEKPRQRDVALNIIALKPEISQTSEGEKQKGDNQKLA